MFYLFLIDNVLFVMVKILKLVSRK